jgi:hypothetical protein
MLIHWMTLNSEGWPRAFSKGTFKPIKNLGLNFHSKKSSLYFRFHPPASAHRAKPVSAKIWSQRLNPRTFVALDSTQE